MYFKLQKNCVQSNVHLSNTSDVRQVKLNCHMGDDDMTDNASCTL